MRNCPRICVISQITIKKFEDAFTETIGEQTNYIVLVKEHKTILEHGPAHIIIDDYLYKEVNLFMKVFLIICYLKFSIYKIIDDAGFVFLVQKLFSSKQHLHQFFFIYFCIESIVYCITLCTGMFFLL